MLGDAYTGRARSKNWDALMRAPGSRDGELGGISGHDLRGTNSCDGSSGLRFFTMPSFAYGRGAFAQLSAAQLEAAWTQSRKERAIHRG